MTAPLIQILDPAARLQSEPEPRETVPPLSRRALIAKRLLDLSISLPLAVSVAPACGAIALAIKLDSPGPVLFKQRRRGRGYRPFTIYKFRTLKPRQTDPYPGYEMETQDPRITRVGRILRRFSLDELPQLLNVVGGSMSLVGARPLDDWESARCLGPYELRFEMKPGLTGLTQVTGRNGLTFEERGQRDVEYVRTWSLIEDVRIGLKTPWVVLTGHGLYPAQSAQADDSRWTTARDR